MDEAKEKYGNRTEKEKNNFYCRVMDVKVRKWYIKGEGSREGCIYECKLDYISAVGTESVPEKM